MTCGNRCLNSAAATFQGREGKGGALAAEGSGNTRCKGDAFKLPYPRKPVETHDAKAVPHLEVCRGKVVEHHDVALGPVPGTVSMLPIGWLRKQWRPPVLLLECP